MNNYFKTHLLTSIVIIIAVVVLIVFLVQRNRKDEKPFERDAGESVTDQEDLI